MQEPEPLIALRQLVSDWREQAAVVRRENDSVAPLQTQAVCETAESCAKDLEKVIAGFSPQSREDAKG